MIPIPSPSLSPSPTPTPSSPSPSPSPKQVCPFETVRIRSVAQGNPDSTAVLQVGAKPSP